MLDVGDALCPELVPYSPPFYIEQSRPNDGENLATSILEQANPFVLRLFLSVPLPGATDGVVAFAGGPITALDWHPDGAHLAVSASRIAQPVHRLLATYVGAGHIQIWRASRDTFNLVSLVPHNGDTAWDLSWRPVSPGHVSVLAVAFASGQLSIYTYTNSEVPFQNDHHVIDLRHNNALADAVRTVEWNPSGTRLASGTVRGCLEIWDVIDAAEDNDEDCATASMPKVNLATRLRVHDFAISKVVWLNDFEIMSSGHDGTVNVRDIRMPFETLDSIEDGLAWNQCLVAAEPDVAIAGTDNGTLKLMKLPSQGAAEKEQIKRKRIQTGSLRDLVATRVPSLVSGAPAKRTALFSGGAEGILFLGHFPRPLWNFTSGNPPKLNCNAGRYMQIPLLQWASAAQVIGAGDKSTAKKRNGKDAITPMRKQENESDDSDDSDGTTASSPRGINPATSREKFVVASRDLYSIRENPLILRLVDTLWTKAMDRMISRTAQKVRIHVRADVNLCGDEYDQRTMIPRISFSETSRLLAVTNHAGFLTVMTITDAMLNYMRPDACRMPRQAKRGPKKNAPKKSAAQKDANSSIPVKKRGRPRKYPQPEAVREARSVVEEIICGILDEPFDDSLIIKPRRGGAPVIVLKASKRSRRVRSIKMQLALKEEGLKKNIASRKRLRKLEMREEKKRRMCSRVDKKEDEEIMSIPLRLPLKSEGVKKKKALGRPKKRRRVKTRKNAEAEAEEEAQQKSVEKEDEEEAVVTNLIPLRLRLRPIAKPVKKR